MFEFSDHLISAYQLSSRYLSFSALFLCKDLALLISFLQTAYLLDPRPYTRTSPLLTNFLSQLPPCARNSPLHTNFLLVIYFLEHHPYARTSPLPTSFPQATLPIFQSLVLIQGPHLCLPIFFKLPIFQSLILKQRLYLYLLAFFKLYIFQNLVLKQGFCICITWICCYMRY